MNALRPSETARQEKFLTFRLGQEIYGASILNVREIIGLIPVTPIPNTPAYIRGVINLRGKIIPVLDLRLKFGMQAHAPTAEACIVVFDIHLNNRTLLIGTQVDAVCDVIALDPATIEPAPEFGVRVNTSFLRGMASTKDSVSLLLEIAKVLTHEDNVAVATLADAATAPATAPSNLPESAAPAAAAVADATQPAQPPPSKTGGAA